MTNQPLCFRCQDAWATGQIAGSGSAETTIFNLCDLCMPIAEFWKYDFNNMTDAQKQLFRRYMEEITKELKEIETNLAIIELDDDGKG